MSDILNHIISLDEGVFLYLNNLGNSNWDNFWLWVTDKESWYPFYGILLLYTIYKLKNWKLTILFVLCIILLITLVDQSITEIFKPGFGRFRPCHYSKLDGLFRVVKASCGGQYSFFSAHSANSFALAYFVTHALQNKKWLNIIMYFWAAMVAYSRVYVGVHYPIDIIVGAIWGMFLGYIITQLYFKLKKRLSD